jgi:hypothetical protein
LRKLHQQAEVMTAAYQLRLAVVTSQVQYILSYTLLSYTLLSHTPLIHSSHTHSSYTLLLLHFFLSLLRRYLVWWPRSRPA